MLSFTTFWNGATGPVKANSIVRLLLGEEESSALSVLLGCILDKRYNNVMGEYGFYLFTDALADRQE